MSVFYDEVQDKAEFGVVAIDNQRYPAERVVPINLGRFQSKFTFGDPTKDSDDLLSSWVTTSWRGGGQKLQLVEGSDEERWWESTLQTEYPESLTLQDYTYTRTGTGAAFPLVDYNDLFYVAFGTDLNSVNPSSGVFTSVGTMAAGPSDSGTVFDGELWIPHAGSGYSRFNSNTAALTTLTDINPVSFIVWDARLCAITIEGYFCIYEPVTGWSVPDVSTWDGRRMSVPRGETPRRLVMFHNRSGEPSVHIVTDRGVYAFQEDVPRLIPTNLTFPPHPEQNLGAASWRTENLYASAGVGMYAYNGTTVAPVGLDRNDGLPARLRGTIVSLTPEHNGLLALVRGAAEPADPTDDIEGEAGLYYDTPLTFSPIAAASSLWKLTTGGWHCLWVSEDADIPTSASVSAASGSYNLFWGFGNTLYYRKLRKEFHTPEQAAKVGEDAFAPSGYLITGIFDAGMRGFVKLASHFEVYLKDVFDNGTSTGSVRVSYRTDRDRNWRLLGTATEPGATVFPYPRSTRNGVYEGEAFGWIQFRYDFVQPEGKITMTPVVESTILKLIKIPLTGRSWDVHIPLDFSSSMFQRSPEQMADQLNTLVTAERFVRFTHKDINTRVLVAQVTGAESTGNVPFGSLRASLLEVNVPDHPVIA